MVGLGTAAIEKPKGVENDRLVSGPADICKQRAIIPQLHSGGADPFFPFHYYFNSLTI